jgi:hypothetical protein
VIVHDFDFVGVAFAEFETNTPALVDGHCPLPPAITLELMQADAFQGAEIAKRLRNIQRQKQIDGTVEIQSAKLVRPLAVPDLAGLPNFATT